MKRIFGMCMVFMMAISNLSYGQSLRAFSVDHEEFKSQLREFLSDYDKKWAKNTSESFNVLFDTQLTAFQKDEVIRLSNVLLSKRLRPYPDFDNYLLTLNAIVNDSPVNYKLWAKTIEEEGSKWRGVQIKTFLESSKDLFADHYLKNSNSFQWKFEEGSFEYQLRDVEGKTIPYVQFKNVNLILQDKYDTTRVYETSAELDILDKKLYGVGGQLYWDRVGLSRDSISAVIAKYNVDIDKPIFASDSSTLNSLYYVDRPLLGRIEEKLTSNKNNNSKYPAFFSYDKEVVIEQVAKGVSFFGGFAVGGRNFRGFGERGYQATVTFSQNDTLVLKASSYSFGIKDDQIDAAHAAVTFYLDQDSIFHPDIALRFEFKDRSVSLKRTDLGIANAPFINTMHKVDMHFDELEWQMESDQLLLANSKRGAQKPAYFESANFFSEERFVDMQGMDYKHPLYWFREMASAYDSRDFYSYDVSSYIDMNEQQTSVLLINMAIQGFLTYDLESEKVHLNDRLFDFLAAREKKRDYDRLQFVSSTTKDQNAIIDLRDYYMKMNGVKSLLVSDSQQVYIYPYGQELIMKKNRDFDFDGAIVAGRFEFFGHSHAFNYDRFEINMPHIDSMRFYVPDQHGVYEEGQPVPLMQVRTVLRDMTGLLEIDQANNKSGLELLEEYPRFQSGNETYAYYDRAHYGAYKKEEFYFQVDPFLIESLDDFETKDLEFAGTMHSAGIFGDFSEVLKVQDDYSLGFVKKTPPEGIVMYEGKGTFMNDISLSNAGLQGGGELKYLSATAVADTFYFTPDSTMGIAQTFKVDEQLGSVEYPQATASNAYILWAPKSDIMHANSTDDPITVFRKNAQLSGRLSVAPTGTSAAGDIVFDDAIVSSNKYEFKHNSFTSEGANLNTQQLDAGKWGVGIVDAQTSVDFNTQQADFVLNDPDDKVAFNANNYASYMNRVDWNMADGVMDLSDDNGKAVLLSEHPNQDGLNFKAGRARYTMAEYLLEAYEVDHIDVADSRVFLPNKYVSLGQDAVMQPFNNVNILADTTGKYHEIYDVDINIKGRLNVSGSGVYDYVSNDGNTQTFELSEFVIDNDKRFLASGNIEQSKNFYLSQQFAYYGSVEIHSADPFIHMSGFTKVIQKCDEIQTAWIPFKSVIDPNNIQIDLAYVEKVLGKDSVITGVMMDYTSNEPYALLLAPKRNPKDIVLVSAKGLISYDVATTSFTVTSKKRIKDKNHPDAIWVLNENACTIEAEGPIDFGAELGQVVMQQYGSLKYNLVSKALAAETYVMLDFLFDKTALELMQSKLMEEPMLQAANYTRPLTKKAYEKVLGKKDADKFLQELDRYGEVKKIPAELDKTMIFPFVKFNWNARENSWISDGPMDVGNLMDMGINRKIGGQFVLEKKLDEDELFVFVRATSQNYYFFNYRRNIMESLSSWPEYVDLLRGVDPKKRKMSVGRREAPYSFGPLNVLRRLDTFLERF